MRTKPCTHENTDAETVTVNGSSSQITLTWNVQSAGVMTLRSSGKRGLMTEQQTRNQYEDNLFWWRKYSRLGEELGTIINEQQDIILSLQRENKRLKREKWNLKQTKGRRK